MHARAGEQGSRGSWPRVLADERARPAPVILDAALLGFVAEDARVDAALERCVEAWERRRGAAAAAAERGRMGLGAMGID
jgi:hypothetical protein